ncbi:MAG: PAS domain S-box protein [bacterium]
MVYKVDRAEEVEQKYRIFFENMGEGVIILDKSRLITFVNDRLCRVWGYSRGELLGNEICSFFEGVNKKIIESEFKKRAEGKSSTYTLKAKTKEGKEMFFWVSAVPLLNEKREFGGSIAIISDITERKRLEDNLRERTVELEKEIDRRTGQLIGLYKGVTITEERNRLAREIHDSLAQTLTSSLLKIELCERLLDDNPGRTKRELLNLRKILAKGIKATRQVIFDLRLPRFHRMGFAAVLGQYLKEFRKKSGIMCSLNLKLEESLPTKIQVGIYRIIREAMNNVRKHAMAKQVGLRLRTDKNRNLHLIIEDDGKGFDLKRALNQSKYAGNFGIIGMEEQAKLLGGTFAVESVKSQGARIKIKVPLVEGDE